MVITSLLHLLDSKYYTAIGKWVWIVRNISIGTAVVLLIARIANYSF